MGTPTRVFGRARIVPSLVTNVSGDVVPAAELRRNPDGTMNRVVGVLSLPEGKVRLAVCGGVADAREWQRGCALRLDGQLATFFARAWGSDCWAARMSDGAVLLLTDFGGRVLSTCGAPDGKREAITVRSVSGGDEEVWLLTLDERLIMAQRPLAWVRVEEERLVTQ